MHGLAVGFMLCVLLYSPCEQLPIEALATHTPTAPVAALSPCYKARRTGSGSTAYETCSIRGRLRYNRLGAGAQCAVRRAEPHSRAPDTCVCMKMHRACLQSMHGPCDHLNSNGTGMRMKRIERNGPPAPYAWTWP